MASEPVIKLDAKGKAAILSYNVPEPTSYSGRNFIELSGIPENYFRSDLRSNPATTSPFRAYLLRSTNILNAERIVNSMKAGFFDDDLFPHLQAFAGNIRLVQEQDSKFKVISTDRISPKLQNLDPNEVVAMAQQGRRLNIYRSIYGTLTYNYLAMRKQDDLGTGGSGPPVDGEKEPPAGRIPRAVLEITSPFDGMTLSGPSQGIQIDFKGIARPTPLIRKKIVKVQIKVGSNALKDATPKAANDWSEWSASDTVNSANPGLKQIEVIATATFDDNTTLHGGILLGISFVGPGIDNIPPKVAITSPEDGIVIHATASGTAIEVEGNASDNVGVSSVEVTLDRKIKRYIMANPKAATDWSTWNAQIPITSSGNHTITARCMDNSGNVTEDEIKLTLYIRDAPRLILVESYRLSSFLGSYGAGRTLKTFSLLPGEKTRINIRTFTKTEEQRKQASSILDSFTQESADDFENSIGNEQTNKDASNRSFNYRIDAEAQASWGWGSAKVSGGVSGGTNSSREECAKNVSSATQKHASKASAKRDVQINDTTEEKSTIENEETIVREIQNINMGRTLNFVFRQMNQQFISLLHLVDVRVAFYNGDPTFTIESTLPQLDSLLETVLADGIVDNKDKYQRIDEVKSIVLNQLGNILNYESTAINFVKKVQLSDGSEYLKIDNKRVSKYKDVTGNSFIVPGIILTADSYVLRTEGIIIEAILGQANALDDYSTGLQAETVRTKKLENDLKEKEIEKNDLAIKVVENGNMNPDTFEKVFPCCQPQIMSLWPANSKKSIDGDAGGGGGGEGDHSG